MHLIPILPVHDLDAVTAFYTSAGLEVEAYDDHYAWVRADGEEIAHLAHHDGLDPTANFTAVYVFATDVDAWHQRLVDTGFTPGAVADQPWGMREFSLVDPSGNTVRVGTNSA